MSRHYAGFARHFFALALVALLGTANAYAAGAYDYYMSVPGTAITGESTDGAGAGKASTIPIVSAGMEVSTTTDPGTGLATGRRSYKPFIIRKEVDSTSPVFFLDAATNQTLKSVVVTFAKNSTPYLTVTLTNALISEYSLGGAHRKFPMVSEPNETGSPLELETLSLTFQKITMKSSTPSGGGTTASDDWDITTQ